MFLTTTCENMVMGGIYLYGVVIEKRFMYQLISDI